MPNLDEQRRLLQIEYEYEKAEFKQENEAMSLDRKVKRGDCWYPVTAGRSYYNSLGRHVIDITRTEDTDITHNFEYGRTVVFFECDASGGLHYRPYNCTVSYVEENRMVVCLPDETAAQVLQRADRIGIQMGFDETTYRLMFDALARVSAAKDGRLAELRQIFHGSRAPAFAEYNARISLPWLNKAQETAVNDVIRAKDVMVVHGPPGTGKTTTLVEAVSEVLRREPQVMVCAQSNTAVDWIAEQLTDRGISVLRIGNPTRVTDKMLSSTYERRFADHPDYPELWSIRRTLRHMQGTPRRGRTENFHQKTARLRERQSEIETRIHQSLFDNSRVIASTLAGAGGTLLSGWRCHTLFIDEAAQALEAACWIALQRAHRVVLAGDHQQLPPTIKSTAALRGGLGHTLMEQIVEQWPQSVRMLTIQYRMNETLMHFSSEWFYGGMLTAASEVKHRSIIDDLDSPLVWVDTDTKGDEEEGGEEFVGNGYGRINRKEAALTINTLCHYAQRIGTERLLEERIDFGIISPYRAQVQHLRRLIKSTRALRPLQRLITVNTIDAFQGQERDVIIVSLVRANEHGNIGFLRDLRRMNVAMTRARMKLIILGNSSTLGRHPFYKKLYEHCKKLKT